MLKLNMWSKSQVKCTWLHLWIAALNFQAATSGHLFLAERSFKYTVHNNTCSTYMSCTVECLERFQLLGANVFLLLHGSDQAGFYRHRSVQSVSQHYL